MYRIRNTHICTHHRGSVLAEAQRPEPTGKERGGSPRSGHMEGVCVCCTDREEGQCKKWVEMRS